MAEEKVGIVEEKLRDPQTFERRLRLLAKAMVDGIPGVRGVA